MSSYFHILRTSDRFLTGVQAVELDEAGHTFLYAYSALGWSITPKAHSFQHIVLDAVSDRSNPRFFTCFSDEDQVGRTMILAAASHSQTVVCSTVGNYLLGLHMRWQAAELAIRSGQPHICTRVAR